MNIKDKKYLYPIVLILLIVIIYFLYSMNANISSQESESVVKQGDSEATINLVIESNEDNLDTGAVENGEQEETV
ncbi:hypothetical protein HN924_03780 [Candidatus Woesearchaeota archaeon]|jgi:hypothetical protein|nr:hypothetical protein [Candidatus Woesearchaeota archaeon]MBT7063059.1 hypothetical protein [Candidatus Woesearchaeota archaeon]MBT7402231.1 hypothetical protein [Candidatus Woesearchaeota archaeon]